LVCVDEHKLLFDIEKFIKSEIKKVHIEAFTPDPNIKAEPIQNGRGGGQKRGNGNTRNRSHNNGNKTDNKKRENKKQKPNNNAAAKIGSRIQEKLDKLEKKDNRTNNNRRR
jgi:ATP-dependent RNA helicase RhlE